MENIIKTFQFDNIKNKAINENGEDVYTFIFTTNDLDRDEEIVIPSGCEYTNFLKNPAVLQSHNRYDLPIGKVLRIWVETIGTQELLLGDIVFGSDTESQEVKAKVDSGILRAVSIGFKSIEFTYNETNDIRIFSKWELLEVSLVSIPANPNAIRIKSYDGKDKIDYDLLVTKIYEKLDVAKLGASISRTNKTKIKEIHDLIDTITMDLTTVKEGLLQVVGSFDEVVTDAINDTPKEATFEYESKDYLDIKENTNENDIIQTLTQNELLNILKGN